MVQNAPATYITPGGGALVATGGKASVLNITAPRVIKPSPGNMATVVISGTVGTGGTYVFNDCATLAAASAANQIASLPGTTAANGLPISYDWPCTVGIVISAVATGGAAIVSVAYS